MYVSSHSFFWILGDSQEYGSARNTARSSAATPKPRQLPLHTYIDMHILI